MSRAATSHLDGGGEISSDRVVKALALFAAVQATFSDVHPFCDQFVQNSQDAVNKGKPGWIGRKACADMSRRTRRVSSRPPPA